jgi:hypothetical protein
VQPIAPSDADLSALRAIASADFRYEEATRLGLAAGWALSSDDPDLGYVQFFIDLKETRDNRRLLSIGLRDGPAGRFAMLPLYYFEDAPDVDRGPFDRAFHTLSNALSVAFGPVVQGGQYSYPHRAGWSYSHSWWRLPDALFALVQDEHDIQFGMDVSLWTFPPDKEIRVPVVDW